MIKANGIQNMSCTFDDLRWKSDGNATKPHDVKIPADEIQGKQLDSELSTAINERVVFVFDTTNEDERRKVEQSTENNHRNNLTTLVGWIDGVIVSTIITWVTRAYFLGDMEQQTKKQCLYDELRRKKEM